ncbi:MAG: hypothetical protein ACRDK3_09615 [Actinomycetota bacterium]
MRTRLLARRGPIIMLLCGVLVGVTLLGTSLAVTSSSFKYSKAQKGAVSLSPMDFSIDGATAGNWFNSWGGSTITNDDDSRCFNAGVHLPQGAKVKKVTWFYTSGPNTDFFGNFLRQRPATANAVSLASVLPADDTALVASASDTVAAAQQKVNNKKFQYGLGACVVDDTEFHGARVNYTYTKAGD